VATGFRAADTRRSGLQPGVPYPVLLTPPDVTPKLTAGGYVFPVYGPSAYGDTFGAPRGDVAGGWHHGDDIFAPLGAPLLAVADGTVFSVGWNHVGGYRLWLRDRGGNEFYYAHLSAYTSLAVNGRQAPVVEREVNGERSDGATPGRRSGAALLRRLAEHERLAPVAEGHLRVRREPGDRRPEDGQVSDGRVGEVTDRPGRAD